MDIILDLARIAKTKREFFKLDIFQKIDEITRRPFTDCQRAGRFLGCHPRTIRRLCLCGELAAIRRTPTSPWMILTESLAASLIKSLWTASLDGAQIKIDLDRLHKYAIRFSVADAVS
jgi:hypothetical protein